MEGVIHAVKRHHQPGARIAEGIGRTDCTESVNECQRSINQTRPHKDLRPQPHRPYQHQKSERDFVVGNVLDRSMTVGYGRHWC